MNDFEHIEVIKEKVSPATIARTIALAIALLNQAGAMLGWVPLEISEEMLYQGLTIAATVGTSLWAWWKNNSFSEAAKKADAYMKQLKEE